MTSIIPSRPRSTLAAIVLLWLAFYASVSLFTPPLLDDADSVHAEVAREMLLRHDYVTLYANGIRYLEKAPLFYWSMALSMKLSMLVGAVSPRALAAAARIPLALSILGLALLVEAFARRVFKSARAGLYAALIMLSSFGMYLFTRMLIPDAAVCLWITLAMYALWRSEEEAEPDRKFCYLFVLACALNVLTKGLIGVVFPVAIALLYFLATRGLSGTLTRIRQLHPLSSLALFLILAAPWHILAGLANPGHGHPTAFHFVNGHWQVPLPTDGNVRGWFWFYFMNEHLLRYLSLRVPHDYDTAPLWLYLGLCLLWLMPFSAFLFKAAAWATPLRNRDWRTRFRTRTLTSDQRSLLLVSVWAAFVLLFFSLSSRQEYYVLPALPGLAILIAGWLTIRVTDKAAAERRRVAARRCLYLPLIFGAIFLIFSIVFLIKSPSPVPNTDLASLLTQNPDDYALSLGHFMDLTGPAIALFRFPLMIAALSLFLGPLTALLLRRKDKPHPANLALAAGSFGFLLAVLLGLRIFSPVLTSAQLASAIATQLQPEDLVCIHGEYESGSTLGFYLQRNNIHILEGRSSNLWYGSFFPDAPPIFETPTTIAQKWAGPQRIFMWQSLTDPPNQLPILPSPVYILVKNGGKEIVSNQPNR
ncbi:ArnT family glycosyltransferase [Granulicella paludicola]|uniref:ArnT family glycosyltransferase n=1 Tax=Granulicella paludicola TaxID=474951 RepID=UPI0021DF702B|nr:phospholipid carrier-dependent glycosyltransferase [Granulicella paludicola]